MSMDRIKIVSGGQTGVDRGALDAALDLNYPCGGWCPRGRIAEDGVIPDRYPLTEHDSEEYVARTFQNVVDSDATLVIHFDELEGGTALTVEFCQQEQKPHLVIDMRNTGQHGVTGSIAEFVRSRGIRTLNVAGPRASKIPLAHHSAYDVVRGLIEKLQPEV